MDKSLTEIHSCVRNCKIKGKCLYNLSCREVTWLACAATPAPYANYKFLANKVYVDTLQNTYKGYSCQCA
jgi:hypothetical protein